jgi:hypothetical protein
VGGPPEIGMQIEVLRRGAFQAAVVVDHLSDPGLGVVLELELEDASRLQRTWPSSTIRLLN